jgi:ADP-ribosylglycohydrolase
MQSPIADWYKHHLWLDGCDLVVEREQARDEGRDLTAVTAELDRLLAAPRDDAWFIAAGHLMDRIQLLPYRRATRYVEPSDFDSIQAERPAIPALKPWRGSRAEFLRRLHGGLLGRICGCLLGKPFEGCHHQSLRSLAEATDNWPLQNYLAATHKHQTGLHSGVQPSWLRPHIHGMVEDDDINYTTTGFAIVKKHGASFTPSDVASFWGENLPIFHTYTAERVAYRNFVRALLPPVSAVYRNPYREWIGAQIRADYFGYANPGNPQRAAHWAWRDASISHIKNGIYGEMWVAAMLAAAYVEKDWVKIIQAGLAQIPAKCRLTEDIETILAAHAAGKSYDDAVALVHQQWDEKKWHHWCHTNSNAQIVALGLLWGEDDYEKTITRAVMAAFDTDCNGATCGSLWGVVHGVNALPKKWTRPMHDSVRTGVAGYHEVKISQLAEEMVDVALKTAPARHR